MKVVIAGSQSVTNSLAIEDAIASSGFDVTAVICGCAPGTDQLGGRWGDEHGIPVTYVPVVNEDWGEDWATRNEKMLSMADAVILVWDGYSSGTQSIRRLAEDKKIPLYVKEVY